jgi:hypothetical protein
LPVELVRRARSRVATKLSLLVSSRPPFSIQSYYSIQLPSETTMPP